jgi:tryptophan-rich sensory protein
MSKTILGTTLAVVGAAIAGGVASGGGVDDWYATIRKPRYVPPNAVFPNARTEIYTDIAVTSSAAINRFRAGGDDAKARAFIGALGANLVLNAGWSWIFFGMRKPGAAAAAAAVLTASSADLARRAAAAEPKLGAALAPYPLWCGFATVMTTHIWRLNR